jgi:hypothetical protein
MAFCIGCDGLVLRLHSLLRRQKSSVDEWLFVAVCEESLRLFVMYLFA